MEFPVAEIPPTEPETHALATQLELPDGQIADVKTFEEVCMLIAELQLLTEQFRLQFPKYPVGPKLVVISVVEWPAIAAALPHGAPNEMLPFALANPVKAPVPKTITVARTDAVALNVMLQLQQFPTICTTNKPVAVHARPEVAAQLTPQGAVIVPALDIERPVTADVSAVAVELEPEPGRQPADPQTGPAVVLDEHGGPAMKVGTV